MQRRCSARVSAEPATTGLIFGCVGFQWGGNPPPPPPNCPPLTTADNRRPHLCACKGLGFFFFRVGCQLMSRVAPPRRPKCSARAAQHSAVMLIRSHRVMMQQCANCGSGKLALISSFCCQMGDISLKSKSDSCFQAESIVRLVLVRGRCVCEPESSSTH